jgi:hypothetical protein
MGFIAGLDLGQAGDFAALAALEAFDPPFPVPKRSYGLRGLKRWPLGTSYVKVVADVGALLSAPELRGADLVVDASGCGRPVVDMARAANLPARLQPVIITAGHAVSFAAGYFHVAKIVLINTTLVALQERRLQLAPSLPEVPTLVRELENYRTKITPALNEVFNAREGAHDDLLLALCLAVWFGERRRHPPGRPYVLSDLLHPPAVREDD